MAPTPFPPSVKTNTPAPKPRSSDVLVAFPAPHVLQLTFNRPKTLNAMTPGMSDDMRRLLDWFESEAEMWCVCFLDTYSFVPFLPSLRLPMFKLRFFRPLAPNIALFLDPFYFSAPYASRCVG